MSIYELILSLVVVVGAVESVENYLKPLKNKGYKNQVPVENYVENFVESVENFEI